MDPENQPPVDDGNSDGDMLKLIGQYDDGTVDDGSGEANDPPPTQPNTSVTSDGGDGGSEPTLEEQLADLAKTYRVDAKELDGFDNAEDAEAAIRDYMNRQAQMGMDFARQQQQVPPPGQQPPSGADAQFQQPPSQQPPQPQQQQALQQLTPPEIGKLLDQLEPDHPLRGVLEQQQQTLNQMHQQFTQMQQAQEQAQQAAQQRELQQLAQQVNSTLTSLSEQRYGTAEKTNMFQQQRRQAVSQQAEALAWSYIAANKEVPPINELLNVADRVLFHQEIEKERLLAREQSRQSQNGARLGRPSAAPSNPANSNADVPFEENPELIRFYYELEQQGA